MKQVRPQYYVTMTDSFMSGWGMADKRTNKLVFPCKDYEQALVVQENAENRTDQKYINIRSSKPYYNSDHIYAQFKSIEEYPNWYKAGYFKRSN
jgi:hypothetical protein